MRLIDADALYTAIIGGITIAENTWQYSDAVIAKILNSPTIEAEPVRHAHWEDYNADDERWLRDDGKTVFRCCSNCNGVLLRNFVFQAEYCPHCGAKMDEVIDDEEV